MSDYDCELPDFYSETIRKAAKSHRCCECRKHINKGEEYAACTTKMPDSKPHMYRQHVRCFNFARYLNYEISRGEGCCAFGEVDYTVREITYCGDERDRRLAESWWYVKEGYEFPHSVSRLPVPTRKTKVDLYHYVKPK